jgi:hypothetical protein
MGSGVTGDWARAEARLRARKQVRRIFIKDTDI